MSASIERQYCTITVVRPDTRQPEFAKSRGEGCAHERPGRTQTRGAESRSYPQGHLALGREHMGRLP